MYRQNSIIIIIATSGDKGPLATVETDVLGGPIMAGTHHPLNLTPHAECYSYYQVFESFALAIHSVFQKFGVLQWQHVGRYGVDFNDFFVCHPIRSGRTKFHVPVTKEIF